MPHVLKTNHSASLLCHHLLFFFSSSLPDMLEHGSTAGANYHAQIQRIQAALRHVSHPRQLFTIKSPSSDPPCDTQCEKEQDGQGDFIPQPPYSKRRSASVHSTLREHCVNAQVHFKSLPCSVATSSSDASSSCCAATHGKSAATPGDLPRLSLFASAVISPTPSNDLIARAWGSKDERAGVPCRDAQQVEEQQPLPLPAQATLALSTVSVSSTSSSSSSAPQPSQKPPTPHDTVCSAAVVAVPESVPEARCAVRCHSVERACADDGQAQSDKRRGRQPSRRSVASIIAAHLTEPRSQKRNESALDSAGFLCRSNANLAMQPRSVFTTVADTTTALATTAARPGSARRLLSRIQLLDRALEARRYGKSSAEALRLLRLVKDDDNQLFYTTGPVNWTAVRRLRERLVRMLLGPSTEKSKHTRTGPSSSELPSRSPQAGPTASSPDVSCAESSERPTPYSSWRHAGEARVMKSEEHMNSQHNSWREPSPSSAPRQNTSSMAGVSAQLISEQSFHFSESSLREVVGNMDDYAASTEAFQRESERIRHMHERLLLRRQASSSNGGGSDTRG